jgi:hypothetical protein
MSDTKTNQIEGIEALLAERRKYEQWLAQLESKRASTPAHVYAKVHGDYEVRLADAQQKLSAETGAVQALVATLQESLAAQEGLMRDKSDERAEAELRAAVGEYSDEEWKTLSDSLDEAIGGFSAERDRLRAELEALETLLAEAAPPPSKTIPRVSEPKAVIAEPAPIPTAPRVAAPAPRRSVTAEPVTEAQVDAAAAAAPYTRQWIPAPMSAEPEPDLPAEPPKAPARASGAVNAPDTADVDELAFLRSVLGRNTPFAGAATESSAAAPAAPIPAAPAPEVAKPVPPVAAPIEEPPSRPSIGGRSSGGMSRVSSSGMNGGFGLARPSTSEQFAVPEPPLEMPSDQARESGAFRASGTFAVPTPLSSEAVKSLKCGECGTLNYPTEWYCERCGGELAAF